MKKKTKKTEAKVAKVAEAVNDEKCRKIKTRGRIFEGTVIRKFPKRITIEFERMIYIRKYERYAKNKTKIHARLPDYMKDEVNIGDLVRVQECRPLSKIIHFMVLGKVNENTEDKKRK